MSLIKLDNIKKIEEHQYFDKRQSNYKVINNKIRSRTVIMMLCAYINKSKEVLLLMNNNSYKFKVVRGSQDNVKISDKMYKWMKKSKSTFTAFHNHPNEGSFSLDDLEQFTMHTNIQLLILCTNSCRYCAGLYKSRALSSQEMQAILFYINNYKIKNNLDGHADAVPIIMKLQKQGIIYIYTMNRRI